MPVAPVLTLEEAPLHPHNVARGSYARVGDATLAQPAPRFSATPAHAVGLTAVGADTGALLEEAGYGAAEVAGLRAAGTIA